MSAPDTQAATPQKPDATTSSNPINPTDSNKSLELQKNIAKIKAKEQKKRGIVGTSVIIYFLSSLIFMYFEDMGVGDCLYFAVVVVTTVGYGDYLPSSDGAKLFTVFWSHFALGIVAVVIGIGQDFLVNSTLELAVQQQDVGVFEKAKQQRKLQRQTAVAVLAYVLFLLLGMVFFALDESWGDEDDNKWVNGLYISVITLTTIGFGDLTPTTDQAKIFCSMYMLVGIALFGYTMVKVNELVFGSSGAEIEIRPIKAFSGEKFDTMDAFVHEMRQEGMGNYLGQGDHRISRFEFLAFMLVQNGALDLGEIKKTMVNFEELDRTNSGFINKEDVNACVKASGSKMQATV